MFARREVVVVSGAEVDYPFFLCHQKPTFPVLGAFWYHASHAFHDVPATTTSFSS